MRSSRSPSEARRLAISELSRPISSPSAALARVRSAIWASVSRLARQVSSSASRFDFAGQRLDAVAVARHLGHLLGHAHLDVGKAQFKLARQHGIFGLSRSLGLQFGDG
jgi:site-specific recombinase XerC